MKYKVRFFQDNEYEVISLWEEYGEIHEQREFIGSLTDCDAWIRLTKEGYL